MKLTWEKTKEEKYRAGYRRMLRKTFLLPNGVKKTYDIRDDGKVVCALALTPDNKIILEKVFRPGPEKVLAEMPAGFIDKNEEPKAAIERELLEETGYAGDTQFVCSMLDDAYSNCVRYLFVIKNCKKVAEPKPEDDEEDVELLEVTIAEFRKHLQEGQFSDIEAGYRALDYLNLL